MKLTDFLFGVGRPVAYYPQLAKCLGSVKAALFVCQLIYWSDKTTDDKGVYKTAQEIEDETGLNYEEQKSARRALKEKGILIENYERLNHRMYYRINFEILNDVYDKFYNSLKNNQQGKVAFGSEEKSNSGKPLSPVRERVFPSVVITENTTEITSEKTTTTTAAPVVAEKRAKEKQEDNVPAKTVSSPKDTEAVKEIIAVAIGTPLEGTIPEIVIPTLIADYNPEVHPDYPSETAVQGIKRLIRWTAAQMSDPKAAPISNPVAFFRARAKKGMDKPLALTRQEQAVEAERREAEERRRRRERLERLKDEREIPPESRVEIDRIYGRARAAV